MTEALDRRLRSRMTGAGFDRPVLLVVVDTEEERTWGTYTRDAISVDAARHIEKAQRVFDEFGIRPTYAVDYPIASQPEAYTPLREIADSGRAVIGAHLHSWVNPPHEEDLTPHNLFPGNLPRELEAMKLRVLVSEIEKHFGARPRIYKAGRYGIGPNTPAILLELGFEVDLSSAPAFDFSRGGGPDFRLASAAPSWLSPGLLELPTTGAFTGLFARWSPRRAPEMCDRLHRWKVMAISSRLRFLDRLRLSPEGFSFREQKTITKSLLQRGVKVLTWSFHSPTLKPGGSQYVKTERDVEQFLDANRRYFDYFFGALGGRAMTPLEVREALAREAGAAA
jgi:hypothetical protein